MFSRCNWCSWTPHARRPRGESRRAAMTMTLLCGSYHCGRGGGGLYGCGKIIPVSVDEGPGHGPGPCRSQFELPPPSLLAPVGAVGPCAAGRGSTAAAALSSKSSAAGTTASAAPLRKPAGVPLRLVRPERDPGCAFFTPVCRHRDGRVESDEERSAARNDWGCRSNMPPICLEAGVRQDFERNSPNSCEAELLWLLLHVLLQNACRSRGTGTVAPSKDRCVPWVRLRKLGIYCSAVRELWKHHLQLGAC